MANFPTSLDDGTTLPNPTGASTQNSPDHAGLHSTSNDAIKALEAKVGTGASTPTASNFLVGTGVGTSAWSKAVPAGAVVGTTDSQTLTNKILTAPTINNATIANPTITADSIAGYSVAGTGTIYGLGIASGVLTTANSVTNAALSNTGTFGSAWAWTAYTPTWTGITPGNGINSNTQYAVIGKSVYVRGLFTGGTTSSGTGVTPVLTLPVTAATYTANVVPIGTFRYGSSNSFGGYVRLTSTTTASLVIYAVSGSNIIDANLPVAFANSYTLGYSFVYEAA